MATRPGGRIFANPSPEVRLGMTVSTFEIIPTAVDVVMFLSYGANVPSRLDPDVVATYRITKLASAG